MYMKQEHLDAAKHLAEEWKKVDPLTPLYGVALMLEELIKRGDDYKAALESMWRAVELAEPNTLGDRVRRELLRSTAVREYTMQVAFLTKALNNIIAESTGTIEDRTMNYETKCDLKGIRGIAEDAVKAIEERNRKIEAGEAISFDIIKPET